MINIIIGKSLDRGYESVIITRHNKLKNSENQVLASLVLRSTTQVIAYMMMTFVILYSFVSFNAIIAEAGGPRNSLIISFYDDNTTFPGNTISKGDLSVCVEGYGMAPIASNSTKSVHDPDAGDHGIYNV